MAIRTIPGVTAADPLFPAIPSQANEEVWCYFFGDATKSRNRAIDKDNWTAVGAGPTYFSSYATMGGNSTNQIGIDLGLPLTMTNVTLMAVCRKNSSATGSNMRIANFEGNLAMRWQVDAETALVEAYGSNGTDYGATLMVPHDGSYKFIAATIGAGGTSKVYNLTDDEESSNGDAATISSTPGSTLMLNVATSNTNNGKLDWVWFGCVSAFLTPEEITEYYDFIKPVILKNLGITI